MLKTFGIINTTQAAEANLSLAVAKLGTVLAPPSALTIFDTPQDTLKKNKKAAAQHWEAALLQSHLLLVYRTYKYRRALFSDDNITGAPISVALCGLRSNEMFFARQALGLFDFIMEFGSKKGKKSVVSQVKKSFGIDEDDEEKERSKMKRAVESLPLWGDLFAGSSFVRAFGNSFGDDLVYKFVFGANVCYFCEMTKKILLSKWKKYADTEVDRDLAEAQKKSGSEDMGPITVTKEESGLTSLFDMIESGGEEKKVTLLGAVVHRLQYLLKLDCAKYMPIVHTAINLAAELGKEFLSHIPSNDDDDEEKTSKHENKKSSKKIKNNSDNNEKEDDDVIDDVISENEDDEEDDEEEEEEEEDDEEDLSKYPLIPLLEPLTAIAESASMQRSLRTQALEALVWVAPTAQDFATTAPLFADLLTLSPFFFNEAWKAVNARLVRSPELGRVALALVSRTLNGVTKESQNGLVPLPLFRETWRIMSLLTERTFADLVGHTIQLLKRPIRAETAAHYHKIKRALCEAIGDSVGPAVEKNGEMTCLNESIYTIIFTLEGLCTYEPEELCSAALAGLGKIAVAYPRAATHIRDFVLTLTRSGDLSVVDEVTYLLRLLATADNENDEVKEELLALLWN